MFVVAVFIPPDADQKNPLQELSEAICIHMTKQLDGIFTVAGNFNQTFLKTVYLNFTSRFTYHPGEKIP